MPRQIDVSKLSTTQVARAYCIVKQLGYDRKTSPSQPWMKEQQVPDRLKPRSQREPVIQMPEPTTLVGKAKRAVTNAVMTDGSYQVSRGAPSAIGIMSGGHPTGNVVHDLMLLATSPNVLRHALLTRDWIVERRKDVMQNMSNRKLFVPGQAADGLLETGLPRASVQAAIETLGAELITRDEVQRAGVRAGGPGRTVNLEHSYAQDFMAAYFSDSGPDMYDAVGVGTEMLLHLPLDPKTMEMNGPVQSAPARADIGTSL